VNQSIACISATNDDIQRAIDRVLYLQVNANTRRAYRIRLTHFLAACQGQVDRNSVLGYLRAYEQSGASKSTVSQALAAIRAMVRTALDLGSVDPIAAAAILRIPGPKGLRDVTGTWLSLDDARRLYNQPDRETEQGMRDAACFAMIMGCGLRRSEASGVQWKHYRLLDGRMMLVDFPCKGGYTRSVPVPEYAQADLDAWEAHCKVIGTASDEHYVLQSLARGFGALHPSPKRGLKAVTADQIWLWLDRHTEALGWTGRKHVAPHDLRRTLAQLMRKSGVEIEQIKETLGHRSVQTTERYLGVRMEREKGKAGVDKVELRGI
jgi:integrase